MSAHERGAPLAGVRVLELGSLVAGPFAGRLLADFGAEVVKVEDPSSLDPLREWGQARHRGRRLWWAVQSRNKHLVTLNLRSEAGRAMLLDLVDQFDVLVENFRPGVLEKLGLGPEQLWQRNPRLVIARVSGYGQTGINAGRPGYASVAEAMSGMRYLNGFPGEAPPRTGLSLGDSLAGMFAFQGVLAALYWRDARSGGIGQLIDVSLVESCFALLESVVPEYGATGAVREPSGTGLTGLAPSNLFRTADDRWIIVAANQDTVFGRLCDAMNAPQLADDARFSTHAARGEHQYEIETLVAAWVRTHKAHEVADLLEDARVPAGQVFSIADVFDDPMFEEREMLLRLPHEELGEVTMPGIVPKLSQTPGTVRWAGEYQPGRHNADVYSRLLGIDAHRLGKLAEEGVV